eukprot:TRINITY_DN80566_c0_g1_i1.p1 TRINITY_DN80566_c0_g1~~TRINITY_DN80566_c0_g1_i1.p1  ORF type:complete len:349 (+),score=60.73 TRINITY_DN80566_c0_g1_i1:90-1049(+)
MTEIQTGMAWRRCAPRSPMALPVKSLFERIRHAVEKPAWATYLPSDLCTMAEEEPGPGSQGLLQSPISSKAAWGIQPQMRLQLPAGPVPPRQSRLVGSVWQLAKTPHGSREVQQALEEANSHSAFASLANELSGHVWEAICCPHANYVLQKCIVVAKHDSPGITQFIIDEIMERGEDAVLHVASHCYGCRILERFLEHSSHDQVDPISVKLVQNIAMLVQDYYGNFVVQYLLKFGHHRHRQRAVGTLARQIQLAGNDCPALMVLVRAFTHAPLQNQVALAHAVLKAPGLLENLAQARPRSSNMDKLIVLARACLSSEKN